MHGRPLGVLTNNHSRILVGFDDISPVMRNAVIAIEDRRFYENSGVDLKGIGRALFQDLVQQRAAQGGSTITQQFVKNALRAQSDRTVLQKMREAALAYHLTRKWSKAKILTQYLNSIYFGNGAYGIEAAARTYFSHQHPGCGTRARPCARVLAPYEAALLAGVIASPSAYDPIAHPAAAKARRDVVLQRMFEQGRISRLDLYNGRQAALPGPNDVRPPSVETKYPYFTTWVRQQLVDRFGARPGARGRPRRADDARQRPAGRRPGVGRRDPGQPHAAVRGARGHRQRHRRGPGHGRRARTTTSSRSTWPRRASASPARRSSPSRWPPR